MTLFFDSELSEEDREWIFSAVESKHLHRVLRKKVGDTVTLTNGKGLEWQGVLTVVDQRKAMAKNTDIKNHPAKTQKIHIAIAPTKSNERMEWFLEKATELGVGIVTPLLCQHSERKTLKTERMEKIMISALKQSQQFHLPELRPLTPFSDFLKTMSNPSYIAHCHQGKKKSLVDYIIKTDRSTILVGPEGDFSQAEVNQAVLAGCDPISLGTQRLRTETAGLVALHTVLLKSMWNNVANQ